MKRKFYLLILTILLFSIYSCGHKISSHKKNDNSNGIITKEALNDLSKLNSIIDLVYKAVLDDEIKEVGPYFYIVDKSMGKSMTKVDGYNFVENDSVDSFYWNKNLYLSARYLDQRLIIEYKQNQPEKYFDLARNLTSNERWTWYEFWIPAFSEDGKTAIIEVFYNNGFFKNKHFYRHFAYILRWEKDRYKKVKFIDIESSH